MSKISFSWDDGAVEDMKLMDLSMKYNIPGMFFIPARNPERDVIPGEKIRLLRKNGFEIGAHTFSHLYLTNIEKASAISEISAGKEFLEDVTGNAIAHFCFPGGKFNDELVIEARKYFRSARTAHTCSLQREDEFLVKPTFHFYDRGRISLAVNSFRNSKRVFQSVLPYLTFRNYFEILKSSVDFLSDRYSDCRILIWGHSWEIEKYALWNELEDFFKYVNDYHMRSVTGYSDFVEN